MTAVVETDLSLLDRYIATGDPGAFAAIVGRYGQVVYAASMRILGDPGGAQDVAQETFFRLMKQPRAVTQSLPGWLHRSATHLALDLRRSEVARRNREAAYGRNRADEIGDEDPSWAQLSPMVDGVITEMPETDRQLIIRHYLRGTPQADLAAEMGVSAATVSRRIKAAVAELRTRLNRRGVHVGAISLAFFLVSSQSTKASASFVCEMGKMHLVATMRAPAAWPPPPQTPTPYPSTAAAAKSPTSLGVYATWAAVAAVIAGMIVHWAHQCSTYPKSEPPAVTAGR